MNTTTADIPGADPLLSFAAMIARAKKDALPKIPRFVTEDGLGRETDDSNAAVRGASSILEHCANAELRRRATNELAQIARAYRGQKPGANRGQSGTFAAKVSDPPTTPAQPVPPAKPQVYAGNRARALAAVRGLPGYGNATHAETAEPIEGGLF